MQDNPRQDGWTDALAVMRAHGRVHAEHFIEIYIEAAYHGASMVDEDASSRRDPGALPARVRDLRVAAGLFGAAGALKDAAHRFEQLADERPSEEG